MIFPTLQKYNKKSNAPLFAGAAFLLSGDECEFAKSVFADFKLSLSDYGIPLCLKHEVTERTQYVSESCRITDEKYFFDIQPDGITVTFAKKRGLFRALCTLKKLIDVNELFEGEICDYPLFAKRGYIEGFYGKPWALKEKIEFMKLCAFNGMNTYFYAPKDDPYHRAKWREPYPDAATAEMKTLIETAEKNQIDLNYCIAPGLSICYSDKNEADALFKKLKSLYLLGIRGFGLLLDDIPDSLKYDADRVMFPDVVSAHIYLINEIYRRLNELDRGISLTVCPTLYHGKGNEYYISALGRGVPPEVSLFWTGAEICSRVLTSGEAAVFCDSTLHRPLYWDNYPVNDCEMFNEMHIAPLIGRDSDLFKLSAGLISNVMEYPQCSKFALMTVADYLWNPIAYDAEKSFKNACNTLLGDDAEQFYLFVDHLRVSCLTKESSVFMSEVFSEIKFELTDGNAAAATALLDGYIEKLRACCDMLANKKVALFNEFRRWSDKLESCCKILEMCSLQLKQPSNENCFSLSNAFDKYNSDATLLSGFCFTELVCIIIEMTV